MIPANQGDVIDTGQDLFNALTPEEQDKAFNNRAMGRAFRDGAFTLDQIGKVGRHKKWGPTGAQQSLKSLIGSTEAVRYRQS